MIDYKDKDECADQPAGSRVEAFMNGWLPTIGWIAFLVFIITVIWGKELIGLFHDVFRALIGGM